MVRDSKDNSIAWDNPSCAILVYNQGHKNYCSIPSLLIGPWLAGTSKQNGSPPHRGCIRYTCFPAKIPRGWLLPWVFPENTKNVYVMFNEICQIHRLYRNKSSSKIHCPCICFVLHFCPKYRYFCRKIIPFSPTVGGPSAVFSLCLLRHLIIKFPHLHLYQILTWALKDSERCRIVIEWLVANLETKTAQVSEPVIHYQRLICVPV